MPLLRGASVEHTALVIAVVVVAVAAVSDLRTRRIPDALSVFGFASGVALAALQPGAHVLTAVLAAAAAAGALFSVRLLGQMVYGQPGMGWGDVKLAAALGALMGWSALGALYAAALVGAVAGLAARASGRAMRLQRIPFAPFMAVGVVAAGLLRLLSPDARGICLQWLEDLLR